MSTKKYDDYGTSANMGSANRVQRHSKKSSNTVMADDVNSVYSGTARSSEPKKKNTKKPKKSGFKKALKIFFIVLLLAIVAGAIAVTVTVMSIISKTESIDPSNIYSLLSENSVMYDSERNLLEKVMESELRTNLEYEEMPKQLVDAFVAIEDKTFWTHGGFNYIRIMGAIFESITKGESISGTSTTACMVWL